MPDWWSEWWNLLGMRTVFNQHNGISIRCTHHLNYAEDTVSDGIYIFNLTFCWHKHHRISTKNFDANAWGTKPNSRDTHWVINRTKTFLVGHFLTDNDRFIEKIENWKHYITNFWTNFKYLTLATYMYGVNKIKNNNVLVVGKLGRIRMSLLNLLSSDLIETKSYWIQLC